MKYCMVFGNVKSGLTGWPGQIERIEDVPRIDDDRLRQMVAGYLDAGLRIKQAVGHSTDHFGSGEETSLDVQTDGEWIWPGDAAFYVRRYGILPVREFVDQVVERRGVCPELSEHDGREVLSRHGADVERSRASRANRTG